MAEPIEKIQQSAYIADLIGKINYRDDFYCGMDVGVFIQRGSLSEWAENIISIQYTLVNNKAPVHGYMSEQFDAIARGTTIVEGQFAIAYSDSKYFSDLVGRTDTPDRKGYNDGSFSKSIGYGFDIFITFGDFDNKTDLRSGTAVLIENAHITSISSVSQTTGEPIAEIYSFFAKSFKQVDIDARGYGKLESVRTVIKEERVETEEELTQIISDLQPLVLQTEMDRLLKEIREVLFKLRVQLDNISDAVISVISEIAAQSAETGESELHLMDDSLLLKNLHDTRFSLKEDAAESLSSLSIKYTSTHTQYKNEVGNFLTGYPEEISFHKPNRNTGTISYHLETITPVREVASILTFVIIDAQFEEFLSSIE